MVKKHHYSTRYPAQHISCACFFLSPPHHPRLIIILVIVSITSAPCAMLLLNLFPLRAKQGSHL